MTNNPNLYQPAIDALEKDIVDMERNLNGLLNAINVLRSKAGLPPRPPFGGDGGGLGATDSRGQSSAIRHDTFFGKRMGSAVRQYLEMRFNEIGASNPAKPREIFDALKQGGFHFEAKDDAIAIISLRNLLRKNTNMFTKVPNSGTYGLATWYEHVKRAKQAAGATDSDADEGLGAGDPEETEAATTDKIAAAS